MPATLEELTSLQTRTDEGLKTLQKSVTGLIDKLSRQPAGNQPHPSQVFGLPNARTGENPLTSRGFSFMKMMGVLTGAVSPDQAKVEIDIHNRLHNAYVKDMGNTGYE